jgi:hypothetical protein
MQLERIVALKGLGLSLQQIAVLTKDEARRAGDRRDRGRRPALGSARSVHQRVVVGSVGSAAQGAFIDMVKLASLSPGKRLRSQALLSS